MSTLDQKYITMWNYMNDPLVYVVNKDVWNSWTPADREIVRKAAIDAGKQQIELARKGLIEPGEPMLKQIVESGVGISHLTDAQLAAFKKAVQPVYDKWKKQIGPDLIEKAERAVASSR